MNLKIQRLESEIDLLIERSSSLSEDSWTLSHWAKYICVRCCGFLEEVVTETLLDYSKGACSPAAYRYIYGRLQDFQNPKVNNIAALLSRFEPKWSDDFVAWLPEKVSASIDAIVSHRHRIAHGDFSDITLSRIKSFWDDAKILTSWLDKNVH